MLGFFSRKISASEGLARIGISSGLTALNILGPNADGIALGAVAVGYLKTHSKRWNASAQSMSRFGEFVWAGLCSEHREISPRFPVFAIDTAQAIDFFEANEQENFSKVYEFLGLVGRSNTDESRFCELAASLCQGAQILADRQCSAWRPC